MRELCGWRRQVWWCGGRSPGESGTPMERWGYKEAADDAVAVVDAVVVVVVGQRPADTAASVH